MVSWINLWLENDEDAYAWGEFSHIYRVASDVRVNINFILSNLNENLSCEMQGIKPEKGL